MTESEFAGARYEINQATGEVTVLTARGDRYGLDTATMLELFRWALVMGVRTGQVRRIQDARRD